MDRLALSFAAVLVLSLSLGGLTAVEFATELRAIDASTVVGPQVEVDVTDVSLRDRSLDVTTRVRNPTRRPLRLTGVRFRVFNDTNARIAAGAGRRVDDRGAVVPATGSLRTTHAVRLSAAQRGAVRDALDAGASLSMTVALDLRGTRFVVRRTARIGGGRS